MYYLVLRFSWLKEILPRQLTSALWSTSSRHSKQEKSGWMKELLVTQTRGSCVFYKTFCIFYVIKFYITI